ncbi:MAG: hypothetical protein H7252_07935 [Cytophaga sp.]|nr:hypothetical protein [Undibacterium sp.]
MWKILVAFIIFAGAALFFIFKAGDKIDMQGESSGTNLTEVHANAPEVTTPASTPAVDQNASSASK